MAAVILAFVLLATTLSAQGDVPRLSQPVNDFARVIDPQNAAAMDRTIRALKDTTGDVIVVATVDRIAPYGDIREYAVKLFDNHGAGIGEKGKDNGILVLMAVGDRRVWIEVGYGLEQFITDGFAGETSRQYMAPEFRNGRYGDGLRRGVERLVGRIAEGRGVAIPNVQPVQAARREQGDSLGGCGTAFLVAVIILLFIAKSTLGGPPRISGRRRGSWGGSSWSGWNSGVGSFGGGGGGFGGGFGGFGGGRSGGGGGGASW